MTLNGVWLIIIMENHFALWDASFIDILFFSPKHNSGDMCDNHVSISIIIVNGKRMTFHHNI